MDNLLVRDNFTGDIEITLVVPVFNEEDNIVPFVKEVSERVRIPHRICIIYDRTDDTTLRKKTEVLAIEPNASFIYLLDLTATLPRDTDITKLTQDPSRLLRYEIRSSSPRNGMAIVYVRPTEGIMSPPIPPGAVNMEQLESRYDREYYRYSDFFPRSLAQ